METIKCIRFEDEDGIGIFRSEKIDIFENLQDLYNRHFFDDSDKRKYFPTPSSENLSMILNKKEWFCAFKNIRQIKRMFYEYELKYILTNGIKVYMLEVSEFQAGRRQIVYTKESIIKKVDISELFL